MLKLSYDGMDRSINKCKRGMVAPVLGLSDSALGRSLESLSLSLSLCWCVWQQSGFSRRGDVLTLNFFINKLYKFFRYF
jgi:hypothetical protein